MDGVRKLGGGINFSKTSAWMNSTGAVGDVLSFLLEDDCILSNASLKSAVSIAEESGSFFVDAQDLSADDFNVFSKSLLSFYDSVDTLNPSFPRLYAYGTLIKLMATDIRISGANKSHALKCIDEFRQTHHDSIANYEASGMT